MSISVGFYTISTVDHGGQDEWAASPADRQDGILVQGKESRQSDFPSFSTQ